MSQITKLLCSLVALRQIGIVDSAELDDPNLPWGNLIDRLSASATLLQKTSNQDYVDECYPEYRDKTLFERSVRNLESQPSGLCLHALSCAFENCFPFEDVTSNITEWLDPSNTRYNVPSSVIFPAVAGDVVAVVEFAVDNGLELSVKNSGHNQAGASSKKDTLLVNTQRYKAYAPTGIVECSDIDGNEGVVNQDLSNQACQMALARDKNAFIRVGGGENWGDVYGTVRAFNEAQDSYRYHAVGGAVATVTPMGWTFQGGLGGTTGGRMYGIGTDQVLQIEAVLPNGQHVRFGPTSWEDEEGFLYPKTTAVSGVCNTNPGGEEVDWIWESCPTEINFDDLWFAFRGGGGGTWGIVTSIYLQLHDYLPLEIISGLYDPATCGVPADEFTRGIVNFYLRFYLDYMLDPSALGVSEAESRACGAPDADYLNCYGEGMGKKYASRLKEYILDRKQELLDNNVSEESIDRAANCAEQIVVPLKDTLESGAPDGGMPLPGPFNWGSDTYNIGRVNILVPLSFYLQEKEMVIELSLNGSFQGLPYFAHAGKAATDQTTSLSKAHYNAGFQSYVTAEGAAAFLEMAYNVSSTDTEIPSYIGGNHFLSDMYGPLKSDPTKPCDALSFEEADEKCFPTQAGVWGENLARLEAIKKEIDPSGIFNCNKCVGNNQVNVAAPVVADVEQTPAPVSSPMAPEDPAPVTAEDPAPAQVAADVSVSGEVEGVDDSGASFISCFMTAAAAASLAAAVLV